MSLRGQIQMMPLVDVFQWLEGREKTGVLTLGQGAKSRSFFMSEGQIAGATSNLHLDGDDQRELYVRQVLVDSLPWAEGCFEFRESPLPEKVARASLEIPTADLLRDVRHEIVGTSDENVDDTSSEGDSDEEAQVVAASKNLRFSIIGRLLKDEIEIPLLPAVVEEVLDVTRKKDFSLIELTEVVLVDQVLVAEVIKQANSAYYGTSREIDSMLRAVQRLGATAVTNVVLSLSLQSLAKPEGKFFAWKTRLWHRSFTTALVARTLSRSVRKDPDLAYLCSLLLNFGKIVLLSVVQLAIDEDHDLDHVPPHEVEKIVEAFYPKVGGIVGEKWKLPGAAIEAAIYHRAPKMADNHADFAAIAGLADWVAGYVSGDAEQNGSDTETSSVAEELAGLPGAELLEFSPKQAANILERAPECLEYAREFLLK